MLLLKLIHGRINLSKQTICVRENRIFCSENIFLQFTDIVALKNLLLQDFQVAECDIENDFITLLSAQKEKVKNFK